MIDQDKEEIMSRRARATAPGVQRRVSDLLRDQKPEPQKAAKSTNETCVYENPLTGAEIRYYREDLGMTQRDLGESLDVHPNTIGKWERDEHSFPHPNMFRRALASLYREHGLGMPGFRVQIMTLSTKAD